MEKKKLDPKVDGALIGGKSISKTQIFLLTFKLFNQNVQNCLVDLGSLSNMMPYLVCKKLNVEPHISKKKMIQLDISHVKVFEELKDVLIHLSSNSKVHQIIDIIVVDILEDYGVILRRYWSAKMNNYVIIDWSHLWLPYKGTPNKIKVELKCYMKHMIIDLNDPN